jgi:transcription termination factor Rho
MVRGEISRHKNMVMKCLVISERPDEYTGKKGLVKQQLIHVVDQDESAHRLVQPLEYALSNGERELHAGKLQGKVIRLGVHEIIPFSGRLKARGAIVETPAK